MDRIRPHVTYANVMVTLLAFIVLGGGAYAAFHLPKNSVRSRNIVNGQVKKPDLAKPQKFKSAGLATFTGDCADTPDQWADVSPSGYYRDIVGRVHLRGAAIQCGPDLNVVFVLPNGFRPLGESQVGLRNHLPVEIVIRGSGLVIANGGAAGDLVSLDGISFRCAPAGKNGCP